MHCFRDLLSHLETQVVNFSPLPCITMMGKAYFHHKCTLGPPFGPQDLIGKVAIQISHDGNSFHTQQGDFPNLF